MLTFFQLWKWFVIFTFSSLQFESYFTSRDLKGSRLLGSVFNILFNLNKFMAFETRDPFLIRQVVEHFYSLSNNFNWISGNCCNFRCERNVLLMMTLIVLPFFGLGAREPNIDRMGSFCTPRVYQTLNGGRCRRCLQWKCGCLGWITWGSILSFSRWDELWCTGRIAWTWYNTLSWSTVNWSKWTTSTSYRW